MTAARVVLCISLFAVAGAAALAQEDCGCVQSAYKEVPSRDGEYIAVEMESNCGATDPFGTEIYLKSRRARFGIPFLGYPTRRVFMADVNLSSTRVAWISERVLEISCIGCEKYGVAEKVEAWMDVKIKFDVGKAGKGVF